MVESIFNLFKIDEKNGTVAKNLMAAEPGFKLDRPTIYRWVQKYPPEINKRTKPYLKTTSDSWKVTAISSPPC